MNNNVDNTKQTDDRAIETLLSALEEDLNKEAGLDKNEDPDDDIFEVFFADLDELKCIFACKEVTPKHIEWFLHSDLFGFMADSVESFTVAPKDIYKALLRNVNIEKKEYFMEHKKVLIEKANTAIREEEAFDRREFFLILNAKKNDFKAKLKAANHPNKNTFFNRNARETAALSPLAKRAIFNHLTQLAYAPINE
ncbi:hypothetical protein RVIR1_09400 [Candidatus Rickettsiella viridis]|uniref:Uncharacterized protein n=1 Tax=Candidatus Rickettsiella viridis TaxID=676208 RepID=A0A2Z5UV26_9COXI|nr:hypothetical protein [Candidatus Rickettsiella viridis]BBB15419.1 hypothetical protein RVIR1_09400 [Candidatus Rickettsiella viridis]